MNKIVIEIEGGVVQNVLTDSETEIIIIDYDTDGSDPNDLVDIPQTDKSRPYNMKAHVDTDPSTEVLAHRVYELFDAIIGEDSE